METKGSILYKMKQVGGAGSLLDADTLDGLSSTDFLKADGTVPLTGALDVGAFEIRALTFQSDVTTGTAPLTVASTTKVTNLNADLLDDLSSAAFVQADGSIPLTANWDVGAYEVRAATFESDVATGTAPLTIASTTVVTNLNADLLDGAEGSTYQSKIVTTNVGTANTGVTAVEYGDAYQHTTVLTVSQVDAITVDDAAALAVGYLLYTFPAGEIVVNSAYMSMAITLAEDTTATPEVALGTVIGSTAVATLGEVAAGAEDIVGPATANDCAGTAEVLTAAPGLVIATAGSHLVHFNVADTWADTAGTDLTGDIAGTVVLNWSFLA